MANQRACLETSFFRYLIAQPSTEPVKAERQRINKLWWTSHRDAFRLRVSQIVYDEFCLVEQGKLSADEARQRSLLVQQAPPSSDGRKGSSENMATNHPPSVLPKSSSEIQGDEIVEEIHAHRAKLAAKFNYDIERLFRYYQQMEEENPACRAPEATRPEPAPSTT